MDVTVGDTVWIDEGDGAGCVEFRGVVENISGDLLYVRVNSTPIGPGAASGSLRSAHKDLVFEVVDTQAPGGTA